MPHFNFLTIAGSDSGGGAGIQADIKTATMLGGFATSVITALTAQNTQGVQDISPVSPHFIVSQLTSILSDIDIHVIKSGMLFSADIIRVIAPIIPDNIPYILDPVMIAKGGSALLKNDAIEALKHDLLNKALLITPNIPELQVLSGGIGVHHARQLINNYGCQFVLIKGGHDIGITATDILVSNAQSYEFSLPRITTKAGHGTGCTLSSAIACYIGQGLTLNDAIDKAKKYVHEALKSALPIGHGHHPLYHNYALN